MTDETIWQVRYLYGARHYATHAEAKVAVAHLADPVANGTGYKFLAYVLPVTRQYLEEWGWDGVLDQMGVPA